MGGQQNGSPAHPADPPKGYSTTTSYGNDGYSTDGYAVVINPDQLGAAVAQFRKGLDGKNTRDLSDTLNQALIDSSAFGQIPNAEKAHGELQKFVHTHLEAMSKMGISLADFVARVQAAAQLGTEADPVTKAQAARAAAMANKMRYM